MGLTERIMDRLWRTAATRGAGRVLAFVSFTESIFFPVPPDLLLIPMALARRERAFVLAAQTLLFSLAGGVVGYLIGYYFMQAVGWPIVRFYGLADKYEIIKHWYDAYSAWAVAIAGLTPIPYKVCTLTAGAFKINFLVFVVASTLARGLRFTVIAGLIYVFGDKVRYFLEKRFNLVILATAVLVIVGFVLLKYVG
ncbi:MAG: DedA family protein [Desulfovibrionaceae bacterium]|jgi:membrane protein YqaA with SNARE-associated domain|nr:DedA family protein [Desulfovibrionaceae bacterium]